MEDIMIQEAVLNSIDSISDAELFAEYDVLMSMADVYLKSAMIQEAATADAAAAENVPAAKDAGEDKEAWTKRAWEWIKRQFAKLKKLLKTIRTWITKKLKKAITGIKNLRPGVTIFSDSKGNERLKLTKKGDEIKVEVILSYDFDNLYKQLVNYAQGDKNLNINTLMAASKKTVMDQAGYDNAIDDLYNVLDECEKKLDQDRYRGLPESSIQKMETIMKYLNTLYQIITANDAGINEATDDMIAKTMPGRSIMNTSVTPKSYLEPTNTDKD